MQVRSCFGHEGRARRSLVIPVAGPSLASALQVPNSRAPCYPVLFLHVQVWCVGLWIFTAVCGCMYVGGEFVWCACSRCILIGVIGCERCESMHVSICSTSCAMAHKNTPAFCFHVSCELCTQVIAL